MFRSPDFTKDKCVAFTGYRPEKMKISNSNPGMESAIRRALRSVIGELYERGFRCFLTGMAEGFDLWAADEVLSMKPAGYPELEVIAAIPFPGQSAGYRAEFSRLYSSVLEGALSNHIISDRYHVDCYARRNDWLIDNASLVVCYFDGQSGGTKYTVNKARRSGLPVINICNPPLSLEF